MPKSAPTTLLEMIHHVEHEMPDHTWLLRQAEPSDASTHAYFANVIRRDWRQFSDPTRAMSYGWGDTPEAALVVAVAGAVRQPPASR